MIAWLNTRTYPLFGSAFVPSPGGNCVWCPWNSAAGPGGPGGPGTLGGGIAYDVPGTPSGTPSASGTPCGLRRIRSVDNVRGSSTQGCHDAVFSAVDRLGKVGHPASTDCGRRPPPRGARRGPIASGARLCPIRLFRGEPSHFHSSALSRLKSRVGISAKPLGKSRELKSATRQLSCDRALAWFVDRGRECPCP